MGDRVSQLQDYVSGLAMHFRDAVGVLHQQSLAVDAVTPDLAAAAAKASELRRHFADLLSRTSLDIHRSLDELPVMRQVPPLQAGEWRQLELANAAAKDSLQAQLAAAQHQRSRIRQAMSLLAQEFFLTSPPALPAASADTTAVAQNPPAPAKRRTAAPTAADKTRSAARRSSDRDADVSQDAQNSPSEDAPPAKRAR